MDTIASPPVFSVSGDAFESPKNAGLTGFFDIFILTEPVSSGFL
jgi:hypothetical protein